MFMEKQKAMLFTAPNLKCLLVLEQKKKEERRRRRNEEEGNGFVFGQRGEKWCLGGVKMKE